MYKNSREKINTFLENLLTHHINLKDNNWVKYSERLFDIRRDLLAQKGDKKECTCLACKEGMNPTPSPHKECNCVSCRGWLSKKKCLIKGDWSFADKPLHPTPSPLEGFEEIEEIDLTYFVTDLERNAFINALIRNQKKLYQYIKEKK